MDQQKSKIGSICTKIIENPQENLDMMEGIFEMLRNGSFEGKAKGMVYLSLFKVFKAVIPLYKVRSLKDVVKDKRDALHLKDHDKNLLKWYTSYVKTMVDDISNESYISLCEVLQHFDHFNATDKIVSGVLRGSLGKGSVPMMCCNTIKLKLRSDCSGELIATILDQMLDFEYNPLILEYLLDIPFVNNSLKSDEEKAKEYWEANRGVSRRDKNSIFHRKRIFNKKLKKMEKERLSLQSEVKDEEDIEGRIEEMKSCKRIYDAIQRLYFTVLKGDRYECYKYVFMGLVKYRKILRPGFMEGLYFLLNNSLSKIPSDAKVQGILSILTLYEDECYDFNGLVDLLYSMIHPINPEIVDNDELVKVIRFLFIKIRQPIHRAHVLLKRLILCCCSRSVPEFRSLIKDISAYYDIEFSDCTNPRCREFDQDSTHVDSIPDNPFFEYFLYKNIL
ncbi:nuclear pre-ribosomes export protein [Encephalitozoon intestinalis ATCC 50506]|uniref:Nuclear pre-ribosomes export protein n=1 Tax=Encephalitozoon intestinalis (strain ATCC 50506) TaxID=876142 RepID=E0S9A0_ENCIT|nr:nuclear pre-ribosomes export protein [Encephalitozoon intestinalis ATCC 50506]ADM12164.2 nuclear pre-ribosomes export protein [Encephalitozoon intestinalis ATCC 50506]UTX45966.1 nucleolar complex-associated protein 3 [Encephalitozoon intestinalis]